MKNLTTMNKRQLLVKIKRLEMQVTQSYNQICLSKIINILKRIKRHHIYSLKFSRINAKIVFLRCNKPSPKQNEKYVLKMYASQKFRTIVQPLQLYWKQNIILTAKGINIKNEWTCKQLQEQLKSHNKNVLNLCVHYF